MVSKDCREQMAEVEMKISSTNGQLLMFAGNVSFVVNQVADLEGRLRELGINSSEIQTDLVSDQADVKQHLSQLNELIHHVEQNYSSFMNQHSGPEFLVSLHEVNTSQLTFKI